VPRTVRGRRAKPRWYTPTRRTPTPVPTPARISTYVGVRAAGVRYRAHVNDISRARRGRRARGTLGGRDHAFCMNRL